jgi:hypothetical protein
MKEKIIYSKWVAYELRQRGFKILRVEANPHKPELDCYIFEATKEMITAFTEVTSKH